MQHLHTAARRAAALSLGLAAASASALGIPGQGTWQTTLSARDLDGNLGNGPEAWYDSALGITWLANTKAIAGTPFDTEFRGGADDEPSDNESNHTDGRAVLSDAFFWVAQLKVGSVGGWRLPAAKPINGSAYRYAPTGPGGPKSAPLDRPADPNTPYGGTLDVGWNITSPQSELAHMFHVTLGNLGSFDTQGVPRDPAQASFNSGVFGDLAARKFWSGSKYSSSTTDVAWIFNLGNGKQQGSFPTLSFPEAYYAWAVHDGDVGTPLPVPEPAIWATLLMGLVGVSLRRRQRR
jgi:hypothetical protein